MQVKTLSTSRYNSTNASSLFVEYLVVAGGGGGGSFGGGGGAGGYITGSSFLSKNTAYTVTIGAGGNGATQSDTGINGTNGNTSSFTSDIIALGGGGGGNKIWFAI